MAETCQEEFMICPCCQEEAFVPLGRGFNLVCCPFCEYCFVVFLDAEGRSWTREVGVLHSGGDG
jgi:hypothetical protein